MTRITRAVPAAGGSLREEQVADQELFVRWLEIVALLPVMSFRTPPWDFGEDWVSSKSFPIFLLIDNIIVNELNTLEREALPNSRLSPSRPTVLFAFITSEFAVQLLDTLLDMLHVR